MAHNDREIREELRLDIMNISKEDRFLIVASFFWFVGGLIFSLYYMSEEHLKIHEFFILLFAILSPPIIYWSYRWIFGGEKSEIAKEKELNKLEQIELSQLIDCNLTTYNINSYVISIIVFSLFMIVGFCADIFINEYLKFQVFSSGWGEAPIDVVRNAEAWSSASMYFRLFSGIAFLIAILISYNETKARITALGFSGLTCSIGRLIAWLIIPFANMVMPWRAFGALDRASRFAAKYYRSGDLGNATGVMWVSWRATFVGICFIITGLTAVLINKEMAELSNQTPSSIYQFTSLINNTNQLLAISMFVYGLFAVSVVVYFSGLNGNLKEVEARSLDLGKVGGRNGLWMALGLVLFLATSGAAGLFFGSSYIVKLYPGTAPLYGMVGIEIDHLGAGIKLINIRNEWVGSGGKKELVVSGVISNVSDTERAIPMIKIELRDSRDEIVQDYIHPPGSTQLPAGEQLDFKAHVGEVAMTARRVHVLFTDEMP